MSDDTFASLPRGAFGAILADPPWRFDAWGSQENSATLVDRHYATMHHDEIAALPVGELAAADCSLFLWATWPSLLRALEVIEAWGFEYKTCAFLWAKAHAGQLELFQDDLPGLMGTGYWTRANSEPCLLATRGRPKRLAADVRQVIIEPRREHSRKPDCIHERIERLVAGPYLELFARARRCGWHSWGNEADKFTEYDGQDDFARSIDECYREIRDRKAAGGPGWPRPTLTVKDWAIDKLEQEIDQTLTSDYDHAEDLERKEAKFEQLIDEYKDRD